VVKGNPDSAEAPQRGPVCRVAVPVPLFRTFDYLPPPGASAPPPGSRVLVPFSGRRLVGIVIGPGNAVEHQDLKHVERVLDAGLIDAGLLALLEWASDYYLAPPGEIVNHALPALLRRDRPRPAPQQPWLRLTEQGRRRAYARAPRQREIVERLRAGPESRAALQAAGASGDALRRLLREDDIEPCDAPPATPEAGPRLNAEQRTALAAILRARERFEALLLAGVTGSGKTEVYLQAARHIVGGGRQVLVLVPEIGLTPQFVRRIEARLGQRAWVFHSGLSAGERADAWAAARDGRAGLLVGTRSAVFVPLVRPGLIVVDEEHDGSFKQFDGLRYHARDVAVMRASRLGVPIVLGSATPSLESLHNAGQGRYRLLRLTARAGGTRAPNWRISDPGSRAGQAAPGTALLETIRAHLERGEQVLVYRNRRGFAPVLVCNECGWQADCTHCSAHMTVHRHGRELICHHCGARSKVPPRCPECGRPDPEPLGAGTERIEVMLERAFPDVPVLRFDRDAVRGRRDFAARMQQVRDGQPCILVGTQMLAKGHHLPGIGLAVMLEADAMLHSADFRAPERLAQSIVQVAGRAGRVSAGHFILETRHADDPIIEAALEGDYLIAAEILLEQRRAADLPPVRRLTLVRAEARDPDTAERWLHKVRSGIAKAGIGDRRIEVFGPVDALLQRRAGHWRKQLWLQADRLARVQQALRRVVAQIESDPLSRRVRWHIDVDPLDL